MAERRPIFVNKGSLPQIGYIEDNKAFDLSGRQRCSYNAESGNLCDFDTGKLVGHVSLAGFFVGASWIADELFGQHAPVKDDLAGRRRNAEREFVRRTQSRNNARTRG